MVKFLKSGKVVLVLSGRFAGRKAVIVKNFDEGTGSRSYPHAVIAGVERYPLKVTKGMGQKRIAKRSRVKPFVKIVNYNHILPTRLVFRFDFLLDWMIEGLLRGSEFEAGWDMQNWSSVLNRLLTIAHQFCLNPCSYNLDLDLKTVLTNETFKEPSQRVGAKKAIKKLFEERYNSGKNRWFFTKLRKLSINEIYFFLHVQ
jgi:large subunit ribosomal protein L27e